MKYLTLAATLFFSPALYAQIPKGFFMAKQWSKEISLYRAKAFVLKEVLDTSKDILKFQVSPIAASNSGELTTLIYACQEQMKFGIVLVFFSDNWNAAGVIYQGYSFKQIEKNKAISIFEKLSKTININYKFLNENRDDFNVVYRDDDFTFLIYNLSLNSTKIRVFWNDFDAEWDAASLYKTLDQLKKMK